MEWTARANACIGGRRAGSAPFGSATTNSGEWRRRYTLATRLPHEVVHVPSPDAMAPMRAIVIVHAFASMKTGSIVLRPVPCCGRHQENWEEALQHPTRGPGRELCPTRHGSRTTDIVAEVGWTALPEYLPREPDAADVDGFANEMEADPPREAFDKVSAMP